MTLKEMIEKLEMDAMFMGVADRFARQDPRDAVAPIIAALRAGQAMRDTFDIIGDTTEVNHKALARKGAAYDKLLKGDEG